METDKRISRRAFIRDISLTAAGAAATWWGWSEIKKPPSSPEELRIAAINQRQAVLRDELHASGDVRDKVFGVDILNYDSPQLKEFNVLEKEKDVLAQNWAKDKGTWYLGARTALAFMGPFVTLGFAGRLLKFLERKPNKELVSEPAKQ